MNQCYSCTTCKSADKPLEEFIASLPMETSHHRVEGQSTKCAFGLQGVCCRLCANGPCRVTPESPRGICGANADTIVVRNLLRAVASGSGCYIHVVENTALNVKNTAKAKGEIKGVNTLNRLADLFGIHKEDIHERAEAVASAVLKDLYLPEYEKMALTEKLAYKPRYDKWQELGLLPGGAKSEVFHGVVKCSTNLNSDPVNMLLDCLKLGISTGIYGLVLTNLLNDVVLGEPEIRFAPVGLRVIDPDYINIMITGHQHSMFTFLQNRLTDEDVKEKARKAGAKGFKLVGCTCVGQDLQLMLSMILFSVSFLSLFRPKKANAQLKEFNFENRPAVTEEIIDQVLEAYKARRGTVSMKLLKDHGNDGTLTGVSETSLKEFLGGTWQPLIDLIVSGDIKGVAGVVGCSNLTAGGHDVLTVDLVKELIARDIIVLTAGCSSGGIENCGLMTKEAARLAGPKLRAVCEKLGIPPVLNFGPCLAIGRLEIVATELAEALHVDLPQLPLVLSAAQWLEEQALADGCYGLALGLPLHLGLPPFITGSKVAVQVLTEDMKKLTGGQVIINSDAKESADILEQIILEKRQGLHI